MNKAIVGHMGADEFEAMIETFIEHRSGPVVTASPDARLTIEGNCIRFDDGRELILHFDLDRPETVPA